MAGLIFLVIVVLLVALFIFYYNKFVSLRNQSEAAWSDIDVQLKRRYDLIPNIVETVKGYASHEKDTFEEVTRARAEAMNAQGVERQAEAENMLTGALKSLFALSENYPELKANTNFLELQRTLQETEDSIQLARRYYNAVVRDFNTLTDTFPSVIIANMFSFTKLEYFEIEDTQRENVQVKF
ncbi:LemA family protein [Limisalsivibrio acetivorans]|uniref:LemA family protein n=1 Tax=Limisalsivibrio acetivorans TaxID=1304888 RepID=UPI0003B7076A|nr:LemA family protein [Limisalsivibrio acetivorans]